MSSKKISNEKTALKLINKYADSYNNLIQENKSLITENQDLRLNLKLNKEIITDLLTSKKTSPSFQSALTKLNQELTLAYTRYDAISKERNELRDKVLQIQNTHSEMLTKVKDENERNINKIFILEQLLEKKNNVITSYKSKLDKLKGHAIYEKETFVLEPSKALNQINDELLLYKKIYSQLIKSVQRSKISKEKYAFMVEELQKENHKLKQKYQRTVVSVNRERENYLNLITQNTRGNYLVGITENNLSSLKSPSSCINVRSNSFISSSRNNMQNRLLPLNTHQSKVIEFEEILKMCGLNMDKYTKMAQKPQNAKFAEIIEMFIKVIIDKNLSLSVLEKENSNLTVKNYELNKLNMNLLAESSSTKADTNCKQKCSFNKTTKNELSDNDISLENNTSALTQNRMLAIKSLLTYEKVIENEQRDMNNFLTFDSSGEERKNEEKCKERKRDCNNEESNNYSFHNSIIHKGNDKGDEDEIKGKDYLKNIECSSVSYKNSNNEEEYESGEESGEEESVENDESYE